MVTCFPTPPCTYTVTPSTMHKTKPNPFITTTNDPSSAPWLLSTFDYALSPPDSPSKTMQAIPCHAPCFRPLQPTSNSLHLALRQHLTKTDTKVRGCGRRVQIPPLTMPPQPPKTINSTKTQCCHAPLCTMPPCFHCTL